MSRTRKLTGRHRINSLIWLLFPTFALLAQDSDRVDPFVEFEEAGKTYQKLWREGAYKESLEALEKAIRASEDGIPLLWLVDKTSLLFEIGQVDQAIIEMEWLHYRRASPYHAMQLAELYLYRGRMDHYRKLLETSAERYKRFSGQKDETENDLALYRMRELLGENPRVLLKDILKGHENQSDEDRVKRYLAAGKLAYRKFDYQLASDYYNQALALEGDNLTALVGLAECYWKSDDNRLFDALDTVEEINPNHFDINTIRVEMALDAGKTGEAFETIDRMLEINPFNLRFLSLKAAAFFLDNQPEAMARIQNQVLGFNPHASEVYRIPGRIASRHYRFEEGAELQRKALRINPEDHHARALYAFDLLRLGYDKEGREELDKSFKADRFNVQAYNMLELMDTLATFDTRVHGPFKLQMPPKEMAVWGDEALDLLDQAYAQFTEKYQATLKLPISVQIFGNHDDFMVRSVGLPGSIGYLGICFGRLVTMDAPSARQKWAMNWRSVLWHEFMHVITLQKTNNRIPRWLSEGISVYEETLVDEAWGQRMDPQYQLILAREDVPGMDDLEKFFTQPKSPHDLMFGYFIAGEFARFYVETHQAEALSRALEQIGRGTPAQTALVESSGLDKAALDKQFVSYMKGRLEPYQYLPQVDSDFIKNIRNAVNPTQNFMDGPSPYTNALKKARDHLKDNQWEKAIDALEKAHQLFPENAGQDSPIVQLAGLYEKLGDTDKQKAALKEILRLNATAYPALLALIEYYEKENDWPALLDASVNALAIDPFDITMRTYHKQALTETNRPEQALRAIERLVLLDPNHAIDHRLERVRLLADMGDTTKAKHEVVRLLEDFPHFREAQKTLLELVDAAGGGP